jgi:hypothetical protein
VTLDEELDRRGAALFLISTCEVNDKNLNVVNIPYNISDFDSRRDMSLQSLSLTVGGPIDRLITRWYGTSKEKSAAIHRATSDFISRLLETVDADAVISWQSSHPLSRITRAYCVANDIKCWVAERGWIRDTLMLDLTENNCLSDVNQSIVALRAYSQYVAEEGFSEFLKARSRRAGAWGRYGGADNETGKGAPNALSVRQQLGLAEDAPLWVFFSHGEPHVNCRSKAIQRAHGMSAAALDERVAALAEIVGGMGGCLVVREHPFNKETKRSISTDLSPFIVKEELSLAELFDQADVGFFTLSTLQFPWALHGKKIGFLSNGLLTVDKEIPNWSAFSNALEFVDACVDEVTAPRRQKTLERRICFLYQMQLIDVAEGLIDNAARSVADLIL